MKGGTGQVSLNQGSRVLGPGNPRLATDLGGRSDPSSPQQSGEGGRLRRSAAGWGQRHILPSLPVGPHRFSRRGGRDPRTRMLVWSGHFLPVVRRCRFLPFLLTGAAPKKTRVFWFWGGGVSFVTRAGARTRGHSLAKKVERGRGARLASIRASAWGDPGGAPTETLPPSVMSRDRADAPQARCGWGGERRFCAR